MPKRIMFTITGPSCSGKTRLMNLLASTYPDKFVMVSSDTTRQPRDGEVEGQEYRFVSEEEFKLNALNNLYCQTVQYNGVYYGTRTDHIQELFDQGLCPVRVVEPTGVGQFRAVCDSLGASVISIFVDESPTVLVRRWIDRLLDLNQSSKEVNREYYAERICRTLLSELRWVEESGYDFYFDLRNREEMEMLYSLSRAATGSIPLFMIQTMSPLQESA